MYASSAESVNSHSLHSFRQGSACVMSVPFVCLSPESTSEHGLMAQEAADLVHRDHRWRLPGHLLLLCTPVLLDCGRWLLPLLCHERSLGYKVS